MLLQTNSGTVRAVLRTYFIVMFALLGIFINRFGSYLVKLKLLNGRQVNVTLMTGWIGEIGSVLLSVIRLRRIPGGWMGYLMVLSSVLSTASDLAVGFFVKTETLPSRCPFGRGLVVSSAALDAGLQVVPVNGAVYYVVAQAQVTSQDNGGQAGIYWKANNGTSFRADSQDIIGSWVCSQSQPDLSYSPNATVASVIASLQQNGALYNYTNSAEYHRFANDSYSHLVVWANSIGNETGAPFDVRASIAVNALATTPKLMRSFLCQMNAPEAEWVFNIMSPAASLSQWTAGLQGIVYDGAGTGASDSTPEILQRYLNSMIMIAGGQNSLISIPPSDLTTQGCVAPQTTLPLLIIILFSAVGFVTLSFGVSAISSWLYFRSRLRELRSYNDRHASYYDNIENNTPEDLLSWMVHATREGAIREGHGEGHGEGCAAESSLSAHAPKNLDEWEYGPSPDGINAAVRRRGGGKAEWAGNAYDSDMLLRPTSDPYKSSI